MIGSARRGAGALVLLLAGMAAGCAEESNTVVVVKVNVAARPALGTITSLKVTVEETTRSATRTFARPDATPLAFPTSFAIELGRDVAGPLRIDVLGLDAKQAVLARGKIDNHNITVGRTSTVMLWLDCLVACPTDGGTDAGGSTPDTMLESGSATCGNARLDPGETCDIAITANQPGACPPDNCDDGIACTTEIHIGTGCEAECVHTEIRTFTSGDGCCPANGMAAADSDCSATCGNGSIEPGETCDRAIMANRPGSCPIATDCLDAEHCTRDVLISVNTCDARCIHQPIVSLVPGDGCCPAGATYVTDSDCPIVCGNGIVEPGELCDTGVAVGLAGACPTVCSDNDSCTADTLEGSGCRTSCRSTTITQNVADDGCCPRGANANLDPDCAAVCGNGTSEPGETCDRAIAAGQPGACPASCPAAPVGCLAHVLQGSAMTCSAVCAAVPVTTCSLLPDGCCPSVCTANNDTDCSPSCGNAVIEIGETCDTNILEPLVGFCPVTCDDKNACTQDTLVSGGTCNATCQATPVTVFISDDKCCPVGGNQTVDNDCPAVCGNAVVEAPKESCDKAIADAKLGACPSACPPPSACKRYRFTGEISACTARCEAIAITKCEIGDSCCAEGCNRNTDPDCLAVCGNAVIEEGETCDKGITAGNPGACPASCSDNDACTADSTSGRVEDCTRSCSYAPITACAAGDGCCPAGCNGATDSDCAPSCGNNVVESGETCDPPSSCPTTCADDADACTVETLLGSPTMCNARCTSTPITMCSAQTSDRCCPTGCTMLADIDCTGNPGI